MRQFLIAPDRLYLVNRLLPVLGLVLLAVALFPARTAASATFVVTKTADSNDGVCDTDCSLREAINAAVLASGPDTITVPAGTYDLSLGQLSLNGGGDTIINGAGARTTFINQTIGGQRVFEITNNAGLFINDLTISGASGAGAGGALQFDNGTGTVTRVTITNNTSSSAGGGLNAANGAIITIDNSTISGNGAATGAAINVDGATVNVNNTTISGNNATVQGGGLNVTGAGDVTLRNTMLVTNTAVTAGTAVMVVTGSADIQNTIIWNHPGPADCGGTITVSSNNLLDDTSCGDPTPTAATNIDPNLANNGGPTDTHALLAGSNALDAGSGGCPDDSGSTLTTDQRGVARPNNGVCDIGPYETIAELIVDTTTDVVDANTCPTITLSDLPGADGNTSLREAVCVANNAAGANTITFSTNVDGTPINLSIPGAGEDLNASGDLDITDDLFLNGNGTFTTVINGNGVVTGDRVFHINSVTVTITDLTIAGGQAVNSSGGGVLVNSANPVIFERLQISTNQIFTTAGGPFVGAGLAKSGAGPLTISNSIIDNNHILGPATSLAGGVHYGGGTINIDNSTISNNSAELGGGMGTLVTGTTVTIVNSTISGNQSTLDGGGVWNAAGTVNLVNSTISGNITAGNGGGIYNNNLVTIHNSTITDNTADVDNDLSGSGGGLYDGFGSTIYENTIISGNVRGAGSADDCFGGVLSIGTNVVGSSGSPNGCDNSGAGDQTVVGATSLVINSSLVDNGGNSSTHALVSGSIAIDNGGGGCPDHLAAPLAADQRGVPRPQNGTCDVGAFEYVAIVLGGLEGGLGPGGVGHTDGSTFLEAWWRADKGVTLSGGNVFIWNDQSGNGNDALGLGHEPAFIGSQPALNSQPAVELDGVGEYFTYPLTETLSSSSWVAVVQPDVVPGGCCVALMAHDGVWDSTDTHVNLNAGMLEHAVAARVPATFAGSSYSSSSALAMVINDPGTNFIEIYQNGALAGSTNISVASDQTYGPGRIGAWDGGIRFYDGYLPEMFVISEALPDVGRLLIENYLSSKYDIAIPGASDHFDGDTPANGDFDLDVAGIGRTGGLAHTQAHSAGLIVTDADFLNDNDDWALYGHRTPVNSNVDVDLPSDDIWLGAPNPQRWDRHWYFDLTDAGANGGQVDLIFDLSEGGMDDCCLPAVPVSNYRLLGRSGASGDFSDITAASGAVVVINGDQIMFLGVNSTILGSNFTVGTLDAQVSPTVAPLQAAPVPAAMIPAGVVVVALLLVSLTILALHRRRA